MQPFLSSQPPRPAHGGTERGPAIMARLADMPHGQVSAFLDKLVVAGLTSDLVEETLRNVNMALAAVEALRLTAAAGAPAPLLSLEELLNTNRSDQTYDIAYNCLRRSRIHTVEQLLQASDSTLLSIVGFGPRSLETVDRELAKHELQRQRD